VSRTDAKAIGLAGLRGRLSGGVQPAAARSRPADFDYRDGRALQDWPAGTFAALGMIHGISWNAGDAPLATISAVTGQLRDRLPLLAAVVFSPHDVLDVLAGVSSDPGKRAADCWLAMAWTAEAAWCAVTGSPAPGGAELLRPLAARLRFLVLSEPSRWRADPDGWWARPPDRIPGGNRVLSRAFGPASWHDLIARSQQARRAWQACLDEYQSHPLLAQAEPRELEREVGALVFRQPAAASPFRLAAPLGLSVRSLADPAPLTAEDKTVIADSLERHLLPRFAIAAVASLALYDDRPRWRWARVLFAAGAALAGTAAAALAAALLIHPAVWLTAVCYLLICAGTVILPGGWAGMWLLRMPAAAAVGVIALISFLPGGWLRTPPGGWAAVAALAAASLGYLLIEARNHGVGIGAAARRAPLVALFGAAHAVLVSLIGLVVIAPAFVQDGGQLGVLWSRPGYGHAGLVLALSAAWCLAIGVFSQVLWEERPITAPLAHITWRRGS
jgi:hypothetical protein